MCPLNKTKKQHIFFRKKNFVYAKKKKKSNTFFREKSVYCG